nr:glycosyltransferase [Prevotella sp.]
MIDCQIPALSIIIPVYNVEKYINRCIDSVLAQTFSDFELLLIDDGSTDKSAKVCDIYASTDTRIRVFHKNNEGVSSARNFGLDKAVGEYVMFVDGDDELFPYSLTTLLEDAYDKYDLIIGGYQSYNENNELLYDLNINKKMILNKEQSALNMYKPFYYNYQGYIWNKLFKRKNIDKLRFNDNIYFNEDRLFCMEYICNSVQRTFYTTIPIYKYYQRKGSAMESLKDGFNLKFLTDFYACVLMYKYVITCISDKELQTIAKCCIIKSYLMIRHMARKHHVDKNIMYKFKSDARTYISLWDIYRYKFFKI